MSDAAAPVVAAPAADATAPAAAADSSAAMEDVAADTNGKGEEAAAAKVKAKVPRKKAEPKPAPVAAAAVSAGTSSRGRARTATTVFVPPSPVRSHQELVIEQGKGTELGEIENVKLAMDVTQAQTPEMKYLFYACFPSARLATKLHIKKNVRAFSGYVDVKATVEAATERLAKADASTLRNIAHILDIHVSGSRDELTERITEFLSKPVASGHAFKGVTTKKRSKAGASKTKSKSSKKSKGDPNKPKRVSSYLLFCSSERASVKAKYPDLPVTEIARKLGERWNALSDKQKESWKAKAAAKQAGGAVESDAGSESEAESEAESEEEEEEEAPAKKKAKTSSKSASISDEWREKFRVSIAKIVSGADLSQMSMSVVKKALAAEHGELVIEAHASDIKELTIAAIRA